MPQPHDLDLMKRPLAPNSLTWSGSAPLPDPGVMPIVPLFPEGLYHGARDSALIPQRAQPRPWKRSEADYRLLDTMEPRQVDSNLFAPCSQATMFPPVRATLSPHVELGQRAFPQAPLQQSNAQHPLQIATSTMLSGSQLDGWPMDAGTTGWVADTSHDLGLNGDPWSYIDEHEMAETDAKAGIDDVFGDVDVIDRVRA
jgi:hypothetical protein